MKRNEHDQAREDYLIAVSRTMSPQQRLEAAARLSAIAFPFHQAGVAHRASLRPAQRTEVDSQGESENEA